MILWLVWGAILSISSVAAQQQKFLRIFDLSGKKIAKGYLQKTTDHSIVIGKDSAVAEYPESNIGFIKTKRSGGHSILIASAIGGSAFGILSAAAFASDDFFDTSAGEAFVLGFVVGSAAGAAVGGIISAAGKPQLFQINGDLKNWEQTRLLLAK